MLPHPVGLQQRIGCKVTPVMLHGFVYLDTPLVRSPTAWTVEGSGLVGQGLGVGV